MEESMKAMIEGLEEYVKDF